MSEALTPSLAASTAPLLILQRSDITYLAENPGWAEGRRLICVEPGLLDEAVSQGLKSVAFLPLDCGPDFQARACTEAITLATLVDLRLTAERQRIWPGTTQSGWDVGLFYLALQRLIIARQLGESIAKTLSEPNIGVLRPRAAQQMYFDSFLVTDLVISQASDRMKVVGDYNQVKWTQPDAYDTVFDGAEVHQAMAGGLVSLVSHVPTCSYDVPWMSQEVTRKHRYTLDLPSPLAIWDVPLHRGSLRRHPLERAPKKHIDSACEYANRAWSVLEEVLAPLLVNPENRKAQLQAWSKRCAWQALNYQALRQGLGGQRPDFLLSDQDLGLNGPLFSLADELGSVITVIPHSGHPSMVLPHSRRVSVVERGGFGTRARTVLGQAVKVCTVKRTEAVHRDRRQSSGMRQVCLLLNAMHTEGLSYVDAGALSQFYQALKSMCIAQGVELILRLKPSSPALALLTSLLKCNPNQLAQDARRPLEELAQSSDLCIAFGEPTTGVAPFLEAGTLVVQVTPQAWPVDYLMNLPLIQDGVISMRSVEDGLEYISQLMRESPVFQQACQEQKAGFSLRLSQAREHLL
jgi:hypothetical protein